MPATMKSATITPNTLPPWMVPVATSANCGLVNTSAIAPKPMMKIQGDYLRDQSSRAMTQAREIGEMIVQFGKDATDTMRGGFKG